MHAVRTPQRTESVLADVLRFLSAKVGQHELGVFEKAANSAPPKTKQNKKTRLCCCARTLVEGGCALFPRRRIHKKNSPLAETRHRRAVAVPVVGGEAAVNNFSSFQRKLVAVFAEAGQTLHFADAENDGLSVKEQRLDVGA